MNGLLNLNYYGDDSDNEDNENENNNSSNSLNGTLNTDSPGLVSLVNYNNEDDSEDDNENTDNNSGDVIIYTDNIKSRKRKISDSSLDKLNDNSPKPKKTNSLFATLIRRKANTNRKQKSSTKIMSDTENTSDIETGVNPSQAISQLINNTINTDSSLKTINLYDPERTLALKKRIADLINSVKSEHQPNGNYNELQDQKSKDDNNSDIINESKDLENKNKKDINIDDIKLNLEEYGLPKEVENQCDIELQNRFSEWRYKKSKGIVFDKNFEKDSALEDPFIIRNLIDSLGIKEIGSNFSKDRFDPSILPKNAHYKELYKQNTKKVQIQNVQIPVQLPNQGGIGMVQGIQFVPSNRPNTNTSGIDIAEVSAKIQQQIKDAAAKAAAANATLSSSIKPNNSIPLTITNSLNTTTTTSSSTGHAKKSKWDMQ